MHTETNRLDRQTRRVAFGGSGTMSVAPIDRRPNGRFYLDSLTDQIATGTSD